MHSSPRHHAVAPPRFPRGVVSPRRFFPYRQVRERFGYPPPSSAAMMMEPTGRLRWPGHFALTAQRDSLRLLRLNRLTVEGRATTGDRLERAAHLLGGYPRFLRHRALPRRPPSHRAPPDLELDLSSGLQALPG